MGRGVFRNVLFREWINLRLNLYELDTDAEVYFKKIKSVIDGVPEIKNLDVLKGIPYLNLATQLFEGLITTFGKNPDDRIWGEIPILELNPTPGGAFLRTGIYVLFETVNSLGRSISVEHLKYKDGKLAGTDVPSQRLPNHLLFGTRVTEHRTG
jgi:hypothetical protein